MLTLLLSATTALAASGPQWTVTSVSRPTNLVKGNASGEDAYVVTVTNTGDAPSEGPVTITDELPAGLSPDPKGPTLNTWDNVPPKVTLSCAQPSSCTYPEVLAPDQTLYVSFPVDVSKNASSSLTNVVRVSGGGAPAAATSTPTRLYETEAQARETTTFGISPGGASTTLSSIQAGAHPDLTTSIAFNTVNPQGSLAGDPKNTIDDLPAGFAGDLIDTPTCPDAVFRQRECPAGTQIGLTTLIFVGVHGFAPHDKLQPVYNLPPGPGAVAKFGFVVEANAYIEGNVYVRGDYGLRAVFENSPQTLVELDNVSLTVWGVPQSPIHNPLRFFAPEEFGFLGAPPEGAASAYLTSPTSCGTEPLLARFTASSWEEQSSEQHAQMPFGPLVGCDRLGMKPSLTAEPTTSSAYAPTGFNVTMGVPQTYSNPEGLATSTLKRAVVTLPEGMTINPSAGAGLGTCSTAQFEAEAAQFLPGVGCPNESKLGSVRILTPSLKEEATGSVFIAQPYDNPFGSLLALYIVARIPNRGVIVKAAGEVAADPLTGRLVSTFDNLPPLPFTSFTLSLRQGQTSPLVTPPACGDYAAQAALTPWSKPVGEPLSVLSAPFAISSAFNGGGCPGGGLPPFAPQVLAGSQNGRAGSYSPMYIRVIRGDGEQEVTRFSAQLPSGLTANLSGVPFCPDQSIEAAKSKSGAQEESEPSCPAASQVGHTLAGAGVGSVLAWAPGKVYMAGPYNGAPFSIVAITSAKVGPFDLGTVVVREALKIDPTTAVVTVDASASDPIPHIIKGIVIHVREIRVYVDRPNYTLNPTNCSPMTFGVSVTGQARPVTVNDFFQTSNCAALAFKPSFKVSTSGRASKRLGASLSVKLKFPQGSLGRQANIARVKVDLPKQLPSRLTTLQKACTAVVFNANPAHCPAGSIVGHARAITPILPVPLEGPAYFVSHGGEAFPSLIFVLQGYGVTIDLVGTTFIGERQITSSTFKAVPDQPVSSFELTLPEGPHSALAANGNLCKTKLSMPTAFVAQNGLTIHQSTKIAVTGCAKHVRHRRRK